MTDTPSWPAVAVVVPVHDGARTLGSFHRALTDAIVDQPWSARICYVDDRSRDETWQVIVGLAKDDPSVAGVRLAENVGQTAAVAAGFAESSADVLVTMDGDLDLDPRDLPRFVTAVLSGHDVVLGVRRARSLPPVRRLLPSFLVNWSIRWLAGYRLGDVGCGFIAIDPTVRERFVVSGDERRSVRPLLGRLARSPATLDVAYRTGSDRDPVTARREVGTALDLFAASPSVGPRLMIGGAGALAVGAAVVGPVRGWRPGRRLVVGFAAIGCSFGLQVAAIAVAWRRRIWSRPTTAPLFVVAERVGGPPAG